MNVNTLNSLRTGLWVVFGVFVAYVVFTMYSSFVKIEELDEKHPMQAKRLDCINFKGSRGSDVFQCLYASPDYKVHVLADVSPMEFKRYLQDPSPVEDNIMVNQIMLEGSDERDSYTNKIIIVVFAAIVGMIITFILEIFLAIHIRRNENKHV